VRLEDVTTLDIGTGPTVITHMNRQRTATLFANTEADKPMAEAMNDLNAILLVDYTITLRHKGMERNEAVLKAGPVRLRLILMTTAAMVFGMLPTPLKIGEGAELRAPMAIAVIGGLITSTLLTLVVVPVVYTLVDDLENFFKRWKGSKGTRINAD